MMQITSAAFSPDDPIPRKHTGEGEDVSPELSWTGAPDGTAEFALICDDPDAPRSEPWVHWVAYNIPADASSLPEGVVRGVTQGVNDFGRSGYNGPMPPPGHGTHHYQFRLYALDQPLSITKPGAKKADVLKAMKGHVLEQADLIGTYER